MRVPSILAFTFLALSAPFPSPIHVPVAIRASPAAVCGAGSYINAWGRCVHRPVHARRAPTGASARCRDGTYSFSESRRRTCSWHGGVAKWLGYLPS